MKRVLICVLIAPLGCQGKPDSGAESEQGPIVRSEPRTHALEAAGLHNLFRVSDRVYSGSGPEGEAGFASLRKLGVKTIVSVDGARPDVETARRFGLTYVHLPIGYDGVPHERVVALAKVAASAQGPLYVHCHHGKHRGPTAVAVMQLCGDPSWTPEHAEGWLKTAGTDPRYSGLVSLPRILVRPTPEELARVPRELPSVAAVPDLARIMVEVDSRWDNLKAIKAAGWVKPNGHPDIDPPHEAVQLHELYQEAARLNDVKRRDAAFVKLLGDGEAAALDLENALRTSPPDADRAAKAFSRSRAVCAACHDRFRDRPAGQ